MLDHTDTAAVTTFEKHFYTAFAAIEQQHLIRQIWNWDDDAARIGLKSPLSSTTVFVWNKEENPCFYVAGSFDSNRFSQLEFYGFRKPEDDGCYGEVFTLFSTPWIQASLYEIENSFLEPFCYEYARQQGITHLLATCSRRLLPLYRKWKWEVLETKLIGSEERYFIRRLL